MMLEPAGLPIVPTMQHSASLPSFPSSTRQHAEKQDREMNDMHADTSPSAPSSSQSGKKHPRSSRTDDDLAETVMNWDIGTDIRGTKRKPQTEEPEKEVKELVNKLQKLSHDVHKVDGVRIVHVKFAPGVILKAKKLFQEPWGTMVNALEDYPALDIKVGQKFWTRWDGETTPYTSLPIYQAVHSVADRRTFV